MMLVAEASNGKLSAWDVISKLLMGAIRHQVAIEGWGEERSVWDLHQHFTKPGTSGRRVVLLVKVQGLSDVEVGMSQTVSESGAVDHLNLEAVINSVKRLLRCPSLWQLFC